MKKRMCLAVLCLLLLASGCAQKQELEPSQETLETASVDGGDLYALTSETPDGLYHTNWGKETCFLDYATGQNRPLCAEPGCNHADETCAARLPENTSYSEIFLLKDGSLAYSLKDETSYSIWRMDGDGGNRQELGRMAEENAIWNLLCADDVYLYLACESYEEGAQFTVSRVPLTGGVPETLWSKKEYAAPQMLGVSGRNLVLWWYDWSEQEEVPQPVVTSKMPEEEVQEKLAAYDAEMDRVTGDFRVVLCSIDTGEEQELDSWTSLHGTTGRTLYWKQDRLYWMDCGEPGSLHWIMADGQQGELAVQWPQEITQCQEELNINLECRMLQGEILLTVCEFRENDPVVRRYVLDLESGAVQEIPLQYIANATEEPVSIQGQGEDCLFVVFEEQVQIGTYLDPDGMPATSMETHWRYGLISEEDFLAGIPNYREIQLETP